MNGEDEVGVARLNLQLGYLNKKNYRDPGGRKSKDRHWHTYWVELYGREMRFFRNPSLSANSGRKMPPRNLNRAESINLQLAGFRTLSNVDACVDYTKERHHVFLVRANGGETFYQAPSNSSMLKWIGAINETNEIQGINEETNTKIEPLILKFSDNQLLLPNTSPEKSLTSQTTFESDDDLLDFDLPKDPRIECLQEQLRQRYALLRQLEEQEKAFLNTKTSTTGPETFKRCHFVATVSRKYYVVPGHKESVLKPGSKVNIFGQLPNGRWRFCAQKGAHADLYANLEGQPGLTIEVNETPNTDVRLSVISAPDDIRERNQLQPRHSTISHLPDVAEEPPVVASPSVDSLSDDYLIAQSNVAKHKSTIIQGDMYPGLERCITRSHESNSSLISITQNDDVTVLVKDGLFKGETKPAVIPTIVQSSSDDDVSTSTFTIHQSTIRKTFPLLGSVPTSLLRELQEAIATTISSNEDKSLFYSSESASSPELSPAPSPITSPITPSRFSRPKYFLPTVGRSQSATIPQSPLSPDLRKLRSATEKQRSPFLSPKRLTASQRSHSDHLLRAEAEGSPSPFSSPVLRRSATPSFEIRGKIRSRGISLIIGDSSSSSSDEDGDTEPQRNSSGTDDVFLLKYDDGVPKNQSNSNSHLPRSSRTLTQADRQRIKLREVPRSECVKKSKSATLPLKPKSGSLDSFNPTKSQSPSKGFLGFFTNKLKGSRTPNTKRARSTSEQTQTFEPKQRFSQPEVRPPMNERRTILLERGPKGWGFKVETSGSGKEERRTYVVEVVEDMPAFYGGLRPGDAILEINGEDFESATHEKIVNKLKLCEGSVRIAVKFVDGVKRIELQRRLKRLQDELYEKQREMYRLIERELSIQGDLSSGEEESIEDDEEDDDAELEESVTEENG